MNKTRNEILIYLAQNPKRDSKTKERNQESDLFVDRIMWVEFLTDEGAWFKKLAIYAKQISPTKF